MSQKLSTLLVTLLKIEILLSSDRYCKLYKRGPQLQILKEKVLLDFCIFNVLSCMHRLFPLFYRYLYTDKFVQVSHT